MTRICQRVAAAVTEVPVVEFDAAVRVCRVGAAEAHCTACQAAIGAIGIGCWGNIHIRIRDIRCGLVAAAVTVVILNCQGNCVGSGAAVSMTRICLGVAVAVTEVPAVGFDAAVRVCRVGAAEAHCTACQAAIGAIGIGCWGNIHIRIRDIRCGLVAAAVTVVILNCQGNCVGSGAAVSMTRICLGVAVAVTEVPAVGFDAAVRVCRVGAAEVHRTACQSVIRTIGIGCWGRIHLSAIYTVFRCIFN